MRKNLLRKDRESEYANSRADDVGGQHFPSVCINNRLICSIFNTCFVLCDSATLSCMVSRIMLISYLKKENPMRALKLLIVTLILAGLTGCLSFGSGKSGPPAPQGGPGSKETIIIVPDKDD